MSWNIRGMNNTIARRNLRNLLRMGLPWVLIIQKTKCETLSERIKDSIWDDTHDWIFASSQGQSGGLNVSWDKRNLKMKDSIVKANWIWIRWQVISDKKELVSFTNGINVYAPPPKAVQGN